MATLAPGTRLGVYEVVDGIGAGGMGTVYRARDTRLPRDAAIKVSSERFSDRFAGEAHAIASLNHPNITTLYDVGPDYLVMELVEGPTLAERIAQGPLRLDEAATIGRQIADALDYAHERGIVHRDLKPGNVKIRPDGVVKVLDFGLAKARPAAGSNSDAAPTVSAHETAAGVIVGTFAYMSPEQLTGKAADRRADVWAFGCVFYEMLTGRMLHRGDSSQAVMASVLRDEPDLTKVPAQARRLLKRCLEKDPQKRLRHIGDVMALLDEPPSGESSATAAPAATPRPRGARPGSGQPGHARGPRGGHAIVLWAPWRSQGSTGQAVRFEVPETDELKFFYGAAMAVSPDGRWMVFPARDTSGVARYWLRSLDSVEARPLAGTEGAYVPVAWTADSRYVLFTGFGNAGLKKLDIQGGPPQTVSTMNGGLNGAAANTDGSDSGCRERPRSDFPGVRQRRRAGGRDGREQGGQSAPVPAVPARWTALPVFRPHERSEAQRCLRGRPRRDARGPECHAHPRLGSPGLLRRIVARRHRTPGVHARDDAHDPAVRRGPPGAERRGRAHRRGRRFLCQCRVRHVLGLGLRRRRLGFRSGAGSKITPTLFDDGGRLQEAFDLGDAVHPRMSPDGSHIAVAAGPSGAQDIWTIDVARKAKTRLTFDPANDDNPVWSPDGKFLAFASTRAGAVQMYIKPADGSADERLLTDLSGVPYELVARRTFPAVQSRGAGHVAGHLGVAGPGAAGGRVEAARAHRLAVQRRGRAVFSRRPLDCLRVE